MNCSRPGAPRRRADRQRQDDRRERARGASRSEAGDPALRQAAEGAGRIQGAARQPVRFRDHEDQRDLRRVPRALSVRSEGPERVRGPRRGVRRPRGLSPPHRRSRRSASTRTRVLFMRGAGPIGYPGSAEVVNMQPPAALIKPGVTSLPCIGDGRQSGTSGSPSILNASPEAAGGGGLALLQTGDRVRIDLNKGTADMLVSDGELARRRAALKKRRRLPLSGEPDAVAGNPARHGRPARRRHGAGAGGQISAGGAETSFRATIIEPVRAIGQISG